MSEKSGSKPEKSRISRRSFVRTGGAALAGGAALGGGALPASAAQPSAERPSLFPASPGQDPRIKAFRTLGRTGFQVSDVGMGSVPLRETAVVRYAYDKGINYFDTAESYTNGAAERAIGEAMQHMDREKIFIASKARVRDRDDTAAVVDKVRKSLERMKTEYVDAYYMHSVPSIEALNHPGYHAAMEQLKAEGRVRFKGVSCHSPGRGVSETTGDILCAAAEDGRFDLMLLIYNFMAREEGDRIITACKANNVGTTAMKTAPGSLERRELDEQTRTFVERYGIQTEEQLQLGSIHWVLQNPDMHTACIAFTDFDLVNKVVPLSGTKLTSAEEVMLQRVAQALDHQYCRHGCTECLAQCPHEVPVNTIMRYAHYYEWQGREKDAMALYAGLDGPGASPCGDCTGPCTDGCRFGLDVQSNMLRAHHLLTLA
jgi:predicted aldo/keto reductase-like oxidoreductase